MIGSEYSVIEILYHCSENDFFNAKVDDINDSNFISDIHVTSCAVNIRLYSALGVSC